MTFRRNDPNGLSNYFDQLLNGIGHRGSSFSDVDAITHDEVADRFLFQEFKRHDERLNRGQARLLLGLSRKNYITVWCVRQLRDGTLEWCDVATRQRAILSVEEYQDLFRQWWRGVVPARPAVVQGRDTVPLTTAAELKW